MVDDDAQNRDNISIIIIILYAVIIINHHHSGDLLTINRHSLNRQDDDLSFPGDPEVTLQENRVEIAVPVFKKSSENGNRSSSA